MPSPTFGSSFRSFIVTVPNNTGAFVSLYSLLSAAQKAVLANAVPGGWGVADSSPNKACQVTLRPAAAISVSYKAWASAAAASNDIWTIAATVAEEYPLDDALNNLYVQSQSASTVSLEIRFFGQGQFA